MKILKFLFLIIALFFFFYGILGGLGTGVIRSPLALGFIFGIPVALVFLTPFSILENLWYGRKMGVQAPKWYSLKIIIPNIISALFRAGAITGWVILVTVLFYLHRGTWLLQKIASFWYSLPSFAQISPDLSVSISMISLVISFLNYQLAKHQEARDSEEYQNKKQVASRKIILPSQEDIEKYTQKSDREN